MFHVSVTMIDYTNKGWCWNSSQNTSLNGSVVTSQDYLIIIPGDISRILDGNIKLLYESMFQTNITIQIKIFNKYDFSMDIPKDIEIDLIQKIFTLIGGNNTILKEISDWRFGPKKFIEISTNKKTPIFFNDDRKNKRTSFFIERNFILDDVEWKLKQVDADDGYADEAHKADVMAGLIGKFKIQLSTRFGEQYIKETRSDLDFSWRQSSLHKEVSWSPFDFSSISQNGRISATNLPSVIDGFYWNEESLYCNEISLDGNTIIWKSTKPTSIELINTALDKPKIKWLFENNSEEIRELSIDPADENDNLQNYRQYGDAFGQPFLDYVNSLNIPITEVRTSNPPRIPSNLFPICYYSINDSNKLEFETIQRYYTSVESNWDSGELKLNLEIIKQDWSDGSEERIIQSFGVEEVQKSKKWLGRKMKSFWYNDDKHRDSWEDREVTGEINDFYMVNYVIPCYQFLRQNDCNEELYIGNFRDLNHPYEWPYNYIIKRE